MKVTGIGGGHGLSQTLKAALTYAEDVHAVVTVADDGGSSGRLTRELGIPPPGDIRNCLVALAANTSMAEVFNHRFDGGALTGHTVGNLVIAALTERLGDFARAVQQAGALLEARGTVHPASTALVDLFAQVEGGVVRGQVAVATTPAPIQAVYLEPPNAVAHPEAVEAIMTSDQVILGPGSLFTSLIATLLVPGIRKALQETSAKRIFVCNARMQKGETQGLPAAQHVEALMAHAGAHCVDALVVQMPEIPTDGVVVEDSALEFLGLEVVRADVADARGVHDPTKLAAALRSLR